MIRIGKDYGIRTSGAGYELVQRMVATRDEQIKGRVIRTKGQEYWKGMESYHTTVEGCIKALVRKLRMNAVDNEDMTLSQALERFNDIDGTVREWANM